MLRLLLSLFAFANGSLGQNNPFHQPISKEGEMCGGMMPLDLRRRHVLIN